LPLLPGLPSLPLQYQPGFGNNAKNMAILPKLPANAQFKLQRIVYYILEVTAGGPFGLMGFFWHGS
jgi:hypothetical protein